MGADRMRKTVEKRAGNPFGVGDPGGPAGDVVARFVTFQATGVGFDAVWADIGPIIEDFAGRSLKNIGVRGADRGHDEEAISEVVNETCIRLKGIPDRWTGGRFDPARAQPGLGGLRGWLWRVVFRQAVDWHRRWRGGRGKKIVPMSSLPLNTLTSDDGESWLATHAAKHERADLLPILEECIAAVPDPLVRAVVTPLLAGPYSVRECARDLSLSESMVQRRRTKAYELLRPMLEAHGIEPACG